MCHIANDKVFNNIPKDLTAKVICIHFPQCEACPAGNMTQLDIRKTASDRVILPGEKFQVDIKVFANCSKAQAQEDVRPVFRRNDGNRLVYEI